MDGLKKLDTVTVPRGIFGFARVAATDVEALLQFSGHRFFLGPAHGVPLPPMKTERVTANADEDDASFLARCCKASPVFGVAVGKRNVGPRPSAEFDR